MNLVARTFALAFVIFGLFTTYGCTELLRQGTRLVKAGEAYSFAQQCWREYLKGDPRAALGDCNQAVTLAPNAPLVYIYRGMVYNGVGKTLEALDDINRSLAIAPTYQAFVERCAIKRRLGELPDATQDCDSAIGYGANAFTYEARIQQRIVLHEYQGALSDARMMLALDPESSRGYVDMCTVYAVMQRRNDALQSCARGAAAAKDTLNGMRAAAGALARVGAWGPAFTYASRAVEKGPRDAESYNMRCWVRIRMNDVSGAQHDCATALALDPGSPHIRDTRADIEIRVRDYRGVIADEDAMIDAFGGSPYGYGGRCLAELGLGAIKAASHDCLQATRNDPYDGEWFVRLGDVYRAQGALHDAHDAYETARREDPTAFEALRGEAQIALVQGDAPAAARLASAYVAYNGYDPVGREIYGEALAALGERSKAVAQLESARAGYAKRSDRVGQQHVDAEIAHAENLASAPGQRVAADSQDVK